MQRYAMQYSNLKSWFLRKQIGLYVKLVLAESHFTVMTCEQRIWSKCPQVKEIKGCLLLSCTWKWAWRLWVTGSHFALLRGFNCWLISSSSQWMLLTHSGFSGKYNCQWWDGTFPFLHLGPLFLSGLNILWICPAFLNLVKHRSNNPLKLNKHKELYCQ